MEKVSLYISREEELLETVRSFSFLYDKSHKGFQEKDAVKNAWDGVAMVLEFIQTGNYFYVNPFISVFETILFIWLSLLVSGVSNLYPLKKLFSGGIKEERWAQKTIYFLVIIRDRRWDFYWSKIHL